MKNIPRQSIGRLFDKAVTVIVNTPSMHEALITLFRPYLSAKIEIKASPKIVPEWQLILRLAWILHLYYLVSEWYHSPCSHEKCNLQLLVAKVLGRREVQGLRL